MSEQLTAPTNLRSLATRLDNLARDSSRPIRRVQRTVANTVVGQMLPAVLVVLGVWALGRCQSVVVRCAAR